MLIDATPLNVFTIDPILQEEVRLDLLAAMDLHTRSIVGWRLTPTNTNRVDAALLLRDIIMPKPWHPGWPEEARWRYHGVPDTVVLNLCSSYGLPHGASGVPIVKPQTVVADNAWAYGSRAFRDACRRLDITVQPARPAKGSDKAHIERFFATVDEQFVAQLSGYTGPNILARGEHPERDAWYQTQQLEAELGFWIASYYQRQEHDGCDLGPDCHLRLSPNDMYDMSIARSGFLQVPASADLYFELLPSLALKVQHYGVDAFGLPPYDDEVLDAYRDQPSGIGGEVGDRYIFRYDPRDLGHLYFRDDLGDGHYHAVAWSGRHDDDGPMGELVLTHSKRILRARGGAHDHDRKEELELVLRDLIRRNRLDPAAIEERRAYKRRDD